MVALARSGILTLLLSLPFSPFSPCVCVCVCDMCIDHWDLVWGYAMGLEGCGGQGEGGVWVLGLRRAGTQVSMVGIITAADAALPASPWLHQVSCVVFWSPSVEGMTTTRRCPHRKSNVSCPFPTTSSIMMGMKSNTLPCPPLPTTWLSFRVGSGDQNIEFI